jgi:hypothetical protein
MISAAAANAILTASSAHEFRLDRKNVREQILRPRRALLPWRTAGQSQARISFRRILARMADITADERYHGPADDRSYTYEPTFILRGLTDLHLRFTPVR